VSGDLGHTKLIEFLEKNNIIKKWYKSLFFNHHHYLIQE
jgi:hypothetical protein